MSTGLNPTPHKPQWQSWPTSAWPTDPINLSRLQDTSGWPVMSLGLLQNWTEPALEQNQLISWNSSQTYHYPRCRLSDHVIRSPVGCHLEGGHYQHERCRLEHDTMCACIETSQGTLKTRTFIIYQLILKITITRYTTSRKELKSKFLGRTIILQASSFLISTFLFKWHLSAANIN